MISEDLSKPSETVSSGQTPVVSGDQPTAGLSARDLGQGGLTNRPSQSRDEVAPHHSFRNQISMEIYAMARLLTGGNNLESVSPATAGVLGTLDRGETPIMEDLLSAHGDLKTLVAPATPRALLLNFENGSTAGSFRFLGTNQVVRHLAISNIFFLVLFFGMSLRPEINLTTLNLSIYEQSGLHLLIKLVFLVAAAGLGASFGALFDVWDSLKSHTFDPTTESVHWMKIGLGIVAGLVLTEVFQASASLSDDKSSTSDALMALVGGFSASLLHVALSRTVNGFKSIFAPVGKE